MEELHCVAGCKRLTGNETIHHKDCPYYPESFTKMYDDLKYKFDLLNNLQTISSKNYGEDGIGLTSDQIDNLL